jgi:hypothetical protein
VGFTDLLLTSCTLFYIYYIKLLHVSDIYPGILQGLTILTDIYELCIINIKLYATIWYKFKRESLKYKQMYWLMGRRSALSTHNKLVLYKQILKPVWTKGIQIWVCTKPNNTVIIQRFQNKVLRNIVDATLVR